MIYIYVLFYDVICLYLFYCFVCIGVMFLYNIMFCVMLCFENIYFVDINLFILIFFIF